MDKQKEFDVICIGQVTQDIVMTNLELNTEKFFQNATCAEELIFTSGGDAVNESVTLAKLGDRASLLARLDCSPVGNMILEDIEQHIDTSLLVRREDCRVPSVVVAIQPDGEHYFLVGPSQNYGLEPEDIDFSVFERTKVVSAASLYSLGEMDGEGIRLVFRKAKACGAVTVADLNTDIKSLGPDAFHDLYKDIDYLLPSYEEAEYVTGQSELPAMAQFFLEKGARHVVIKCGSKGAYYQDADETFQIGAFPVKALDTTGCGDNFVAGFIHGLLKGWSHKKCVTFASATGAVNAMSYGGHLGVTGEEQILEFLEKNEI